MLVPNPAIGQELLDTAILDTLLIAAVQVIARLIQVEWEQLLQISFQVCF